MASTERKQESENGIMDAGACNRIQGKVDRWMAATFDRETIEDRRERCFRFFEESCELAQAGGITEAEARQLVAYVWDREPGRVKAEIGDVMVTLSALASGFGVTLASAFDAVMRHIWTSRLIIRAKHESKKMRGPLPGDG